MKKIISFAFLLFVFNVNAMACELCIYVDATTSGGVIFDIISTDNKYQYTNTGPVAPGKPACFNQMVCPIPYNIYAQIVTNSGARKNPYGDYVYMYNPLQLTGDLSLYFPRDFVLDPSHHSEQAQNP